MGAHVETSCSSVLAISDGGARMTSPGIREFIYLGTKSVDWCGNFDIILEISPAFSHLYITRHAPCDMPCLAPMRIGRP